MKSLSLCVADHHLAPRLSLRLSDLCLSSPQTHVSSLLSQLAALTAAFSSFFFFCNCTHECFLTHAVWMAVMDTVQLLNLLLRAQDWRCIITADSQEADNKSNRRTVAFICEHSKYTSTGSTRVVRGLTRRHYAKTFALESWDVCLVKLQLPVQSLYFRFIPLCLD